MNVQEAVALLRRHNEWRRGAGGEMIEPRWLGLAIDLLCDHFSHAAEMVCLPPEIDPTSRVLGGIKYAPNFVSGWNRCRVAMIDATPAPVAQKVPDGFVLVPVEPTEAMVIAALQKVDPLRELIDWSDGHGFMREDARLAWSAMLAAAQAQEGK